MFNNQIIISPPTGMKKGIKGKAYSLTLRKIHLQQFVSTFLKVQTAKGKKHLLLTSISYCAVHTALKNTFQNETDRDYVIIYNDICHSKKESSKFRTVQLVASMLPTGPCNRHSHCHTAGQSGLYHWQKSMLPYGGREGLGVVHCQCTMWRRDHIPPGLPSWLRG